MSRPLIALSAGAILAAYGAGYALTQPVASQLGPTSTFTQAATSSNYRDGVYVATGASIFGDVTVAVKIQQHKIANVQITATTTSYSESWIDGLPAQALARQGANVDTVSGASYSSQAFRDAVQQALQQAGS